MKRVALIHNRALPIAAIVATLVALVATRLPHLSTGPLNFDEGVYWLSMRSMRAGNSLFTSVYSSQPPAFLQVTEPPWDWLGGSIEAGRAVILAWSVVGVGAGAVLGWCLGGRVVGVATAVLLTIDPRMVDQSITLQADGPATSLALLSLAAAALTVTLRSGRWRAVAAVVCGAAMGLGILTKLFDVGVVPCLVFVLLSGGHRWRRLGLAAAGLVGLSTAVAGAVGALVLNHALTALDAPTNVALVTRLQAPSPASSRLIGDDQFDQALAARDAPPQFVDTSGVRLRGGGVTAATLETVLLADPRVCGVLFASGRLSGVPGFIAWVAQEYPVRNVVAAGAVLYTRSPCKPSAAGMGDVSWRS